MATSRPTPSIDTLLQACIRFLVGHGRRTPQSVWAEVGEILDGASGDFYGTGGMVDELESEICALLGKPAAVLMPTGTMAQQIAMRVHAEHNGRKVLLWHPTCHLQLHEDQAVSRLHGLSPRPVGDKHRVLTVDDLEPVAEYAAVLLIELPQREIGGLLPDWDDLLAQTELARSHGTAVHLDGARLLECLPHYGKTAAEVAGLFDSVYISLYKGLGGFAGAVLAGDEQFVAEAREWRHRHGGNMFAMWPVAASGLAGLRRRVPLIPRYVDHAGDICAALAAIDGVSVVPDPPVTNMAHVYLPTDGRAFEAATRSLAEEEKIWTWSGAGTTNLPGQVVVELTVGDATLEWSPGEVRDVVAELLARAGSVSPEQAE
jgi:threonine aldolase